MELLGCLANIAAILTAVVAVFGYGKYRLDQCKKRKQLEAYLKQEAASGDKGQRSLLHLIAKVGMTEAELIQASFSSEKIIRKIAKDDETGRADALLLQWKE